MLCDARRLKDPFLNEAHMDDEAARELLKKFMTTGSNPNRPANPDIIPKRNPPPKPGEPDPYNLTNA